MRRLNNPHPINTSKVFDFFNVLLITIFTLLIIVPILNILASSFASNTALAKGDFIFFPSEFTLDNYKAVLNDSTITRAFLISVSKTVIGVVTHVSFCAMVAYGLSKPELKFRKLYTAIGVFTMYFSGGMIPYYLLIKSLGLRNNFLVYIIPALFSYYDVVVLMNFFRQIPASLEESATIDGAGPWTVFLRIILPLSKPALATIALFNGVNQWNDFMTAKLYVTDETLWPLQMKLYEIIVQSQASSTNVVGSVVLSTTTKGIQLATIVVTTVPILIIYPLLQKHFVTGMMLGAVKE